MKNAYQASLVRDSYRASATASACGGSCCADLTGSPRWTAGAFLDPAVTSRSMSPATDQWRRRRQHDHRSRSGEPGSAHRGRAAPTHGAKYRDEFGVLVDEEAEYDAWVQFEPTGVEVRMGLKGILLQYPFPLRELYEVIEELEEDFEDDFKNEFATD